MKYTLIGITLYSSLVMGNVNITKDIASLTIEENGKKIKIERIQDTKHRLVSNFTKTSRECPPYCIQPMNIENTKTIGELELLEYMKEIAKEDSNMLLIDTRTREWYNEGTLPTAINLPFTMLQEKSKHLKKILNLLGAKENDGKWTFNFVPSLILFSNGVWDEEATVAIKSLLKLGYPEDKIIYYRGGLQSWNILGLTLK